MDAVIAKDWKETTIGEVVEFFDRQRIPLSGKQRKERQGPYPYYGASGIIDYIDDYIFDGKYLLIAEDGENLNSRKLPIAFFAQGKFWVNNHAHIVRAIPGVADDDFLCAWFAQANISGYITGAAQPKLSQANLKRISLRLPPYPIQKKIAAILSTYDDLIDNNLRRIKILEEMAQQLYREWFVKFRFPGHENVRMVDSPLGKIPEGWDISPLGDIADVRWGDTSTTKKSYVDDGYLAYSAAGPDGKLDHYDFDRDGIVLSAIGANCGLTWLAKGKWSCIKNTIRFWATDPRVSTEYLYYATLGKEFWPKRGAAQPFISQGDAKAVSIVVPGNGLGERFTEVVEPMLDLSRSLVAKNTNLRQTRDLLLPKLISGELDVSELDIATGQEAA